jgi:hypothetical protein
VDVARHIISSGNMLARFRFNLTAETQGRLQVTRQYAMTGRPGRARHAVVPDRARQHDTASPSTVLVPADLAPTEATEAIEAIEATEKTLGVLRTLCEKPWRTRLPNDAG